MWFLWFFIILLEVVGSLNCSKIANLGPRTYSNTFWIIFGTSKCFTKSAHLQSLFITKTLKRIQEHPQTSSKQIISTYLEFQHVVKLLKRRAPINPEESLKESPKSWILDKYLSKNTNGCLLIWYQYIYIYIYTYHKT